MGELLGSQAMTGAERVRRHRARRRLREEEAEFRAFIRAGLLGDDEEALHEIVEFFVGLPDQLAALRRDLDELREAGGAPSR